jgi:hypothetical protein
MLVAQVHRQINTPQVAVEALQQLALLVWELLRAQAAMALHRPSQGPL